MLSKMKIIIIIAIIAGASATFGIYRFLDSQKDKIKDVKASMQYVVVAGTDLPMGKKLVAADLKVKEWPKELAPPGCFSDTSELVGRVINTPIYQAETIMKSKLAPAGSEGGFSSIIPTGMRALTVSVNTSSGVSGFILPNTRVDVLVTVPSHNQKSESTTKIILEDVKVLAVDQTFERDNDKPVIVQTVTLLVKPADAEKLVLASTEGKLQLSLRNNADRAQKPTTGVKLRELIAKPTPSRLVRKTQPKPSKKNKTPQRVVEIIRSSEKTEVTVEGKIQNQK